MPVIRMKQPFRFAAATTAVIAVSSPAWAFPQASEGKWDFSPFIAIPLLAAATLYVVGTLRIAPSIRAGRWFSTLCFVLGWSSLVLALESPIHEIGEQLFWVHMVQHEILMLVSAPLIALGHPLTVSLFAFPESWRRPVSRLSRFKGIQALESWFTSPMSAWLISAAALWVWHLPWLFDRAVRIDWIHAAQHTSFFLSALLFWNPLAGNKRTIGYGAGILYLFTTALHTSVLGALLTFAPRPWYHPYLVTAPLWHLTALEDQQLGGLIMWIPAGSLLLIVALGLLARWLQESQMRWQYTDIAELAKRSSEGVIQ